MYCFTALEYFYTWLPSYMIVIIYYMHEYIHTYPICTTISYLLYLAKSVGGFVRDLLDEETDMRLAPRFALVNVRVMYLEKCFYY